MEPVSGGALVAARVHRAGAPPSASSSRTSTTWGAWRPLWANPVPRGAGEPRRTSSVTPRAPLQRSVVAGRCQRQDLLLEVRDQGRGLRDGRTGGATVRLRPVTTMARWDPDDARTRRSTLAVSSTSISPTTAPLFRCRVPLPGAQPMNPRWRILIADDHEVVRFGVRAVIEKAEDGSSAAKPAPAAPQVAQAIALRPDVVVPRHRSMPELERTRGHAQDSPGHPDLDPDLDDARFRRRSSPTC